MNVGSKSLHLKRVDRVGPSPRNHPSRHVHDRIVSDMLDEQHVAVRGSMDLHQTGGVAIAIISAIFFHRTAEAPRSLGPRDRAIVTIRSPEARSDGYEDTWKNSTIAVRSNRDHGAIEPRSGNF